jgi:hypothetical protein
MHHLKLGVRDESVFIFGKMLTYDNRIKTFKHLGKIRMAEIEVEDERLV